MANKHKGACFCGAVEIEAVGTPLEMGYCHCNSCRTHSGALVGTYMLWKTDDIKVTRGAEFLAGFNKTGMSERQFCMKCGGHIMTGHPGLGITDVRATIMSSPAFEPTIHLHYAETVFPMKDGLLKLKDFPAVVGGSGQAIPE